jgi:DNA invertase Pin-like site-specific DNA recombinase
MARKMARHRKEAFAYLRTSSAGSVGADKDSDKRQRTAIEAFARSHGYSIVEEFYDAAVSGVDPIEARPGFTALLARIAGNGVRTIIVETANRFARDLMVQEVGFAMLQGLGITLIAADSPASVLDDGPTSKLIRQTSFRAAFRRGGGRVATATLTRPARLDGGYAQRAARERKGLAVGGIDRD